jgi:Protein of unknown function (DUF1194)
MICAWLRSVWYALVLSGAMWGGRATAQDGAVDLALVLAVDCSFSVSSEEFRLQMRGMGRALQNPEVWTAIQNAPHKRIAILVMQWSDKDNQQVVMPWAVIASQADAISMGRSMEIVTRELAEGGTAISRAIAFANRAFQTAPPATRRVIDVSFDGRNNAGPALPPVRDQIVGDGVVINALPITNEVPTLDIYADHQLIGGQGAFVIKANDYESYADAILRKLIREIIGPGIS